MLLRLRLISRQTSHFIYNGKSLQWLITAWLPQLEELHPKNEVTFCQCRICISKRACVRVLLVASVWPTNHFTQLHESEITQWQGCFLLCRIKRIWRVCESRAGSLALYRAPALSRSLVGVLLESIHTHTHYTAHAEMLAPAEVWGNHEFGRQMVQVQLGSSKDVYSI